MTVIRRVPRDFDWPLDKTWEGYLQPDRLRGTPCPDCAGGQTYAAWWLQRLCQRLAMLATDVADQQRGRPMHPWLTQDPYPAHVETGDSRTPWQVARPSEDIIALVEGLGAEPGLLGYSGSDHKMFAAIVKAAGLTAFTDDASENFEHSWGICRTCDGRGTTETYPGQRAEADAWEATEPPTGDGWQAWEDVSEGSPISPVFATREGLVEWFTTPASAWGARRQPLTRRQAEALVDAGSSIGSFVVAHHEDGTAEMLSGDEAVGRARS